MCVCVGGGLTPPPTHTHIQGGDAVFSITLMSMALISLQVDHHRLHSIYVVRLKSDTLLTSKKLTQRNPGPIGIISCVPNYAPLDMGSIHAYRPTTCR